MNPFVKFAVFGVLGPIVIGLLSFLLMKHAATSATIDPTNSMQRQSAAALERARAQQAEATRREAEAERVRLEDEAARTRSELTAARLEQQEAARKEAAWQMFFQPKKICDNPPDSTTLVECGNAYIRAKREFEAQWERGELR